MGTITATIVSWLSNKSPNVTKRRRPAARAQVAHLSERVEQLTELLLRTQHLDDAGLNALQGNGYS